MNHKATDVGEDSFVYPLRHTPPTEPPGYRGKNTSGTPADTYVEGGLQSYLMEYFMYPLIALANRCVMKWDGYVYIGGVMAAFADANQLKQIEDACKDHAKRLTEKIEKK